MSKQRNGQAPDRRQRLDTRRWRENVGLRGWRLHVAAAVIALALAWSLAGYLLAPWAVERYAHDIVRERLGVELVLDDVDIDPWRLRAEAGSATMAHAELGHLVGVRRVSVNLELASLWRRAWLVSDVVIDGPKVSVIRLPDGDWNFARAFEPREEEPRKDAAAPKFLLARLVIRDGRLDFTDRTVPDGYATQIGPVNVSLKDFGTTKQADGQTVIRAQLADGGTITWRSDLELEPLAAKGRLEVGDASGELVWRYFRDRVNFELLKGRWDLGIDYRFRLGQAGPELDVDDGDLALRDIAIGAPGDGESILTLPSGSISGASFRMADLDLAAGNVRAEGPLLKVHRTPAGAINVERLFAAPPAGDAQANGGPRENSGDKSQGRPSQPGKELSWRVDSFVIEDGRIEVRDDAAPDPVEFAVASLEASLSDYRNAAGHNGRLELDAKMESGGEIEVKGALAGPPLSLDATAKIEALDLLPFAAYAANAARLDFRSAKAFLNGRISVAGEQPFRFEGDAALIGIAASLPDSESPVVAWERLDLNQMTFDVGERSAEVASVTLRQPFLEIQVNRDGELNLSRISPRDDDAAAGPAERESAEERFHVSVQEVRVDSGEINFEDLDLPLPFAARIQSLDGSISRISSRADTPARLELEGTVEEYGSARIDGQLDLFHPTRLAELAIAFRNVKMPDLSPYTIKFAGRSIEKGTIDLTLDWKIRNGELRAANDMVIEQLELGPKQEVEGAMDLPLDLAVALLKDSQGRIDVDLPVSGNLDDPDFSYSGVVFQALRRLLTDIATAPFKLLGALFGGGNGDEDALEYVPFPPGKSTVAGPQREVLDVLGKALGQRPQLSLELPATFHRQRDSRALRVERVEQLVAEQLEATAEGEDRLREVLETLYAEAKGDDALEALEAEHSQAPQGRQNTDPGAEPGLATADYVRALRNELELLQPVNDEALQNLGRRRARAVRDYLVSEGAIDARRIAIADPVAAQKADERNVYMKLKLAVGSR